MPALATKSLTPQRGELQELGFSRPLPYKSGNPRARLALHFHGPIRSVNSYIPIPALGQAFRLCTLLLLTFLAAPLFPQQAPPPTGSTAEITARGAQRRVGSMYIADDDVDITYNGMRLRADHAEYDDST